ncbi:protein SEED AND ROOT HAIR PROTECTIVE PROTEIN-like [Andrographis paniculata]|uniref:protein SEED AND ROOT HAIR PROTECTIVE PROTEIN-like n=1 Tax=Andrographis paniculata TaxID=175694 RepID=UPI0021E8CC9F|nr:protein SEED AND ROOT HAIR PROTECTIVE PROTEIN-like [Andrographis paniculata]
MGSAGFVPRTFYLKLLMILSAAAAVAAASASGYTYSYGGEAPHTAAGKSFLPEVFAVQGIVYCRSGHKLNPLKGSVLRITCLGVDKYGYETAPFSILTRATDGNGYFLAKLSAKHLEDGGVKLSECKAFLQSSPLKDCQLATDVNKGLSGAPLSSFRPIGSGGLRLYSVGPFVYSTVPQQTPAFLPYY